jgi:hypothetical protein
MDYEQMRDKIETLEKNDRYYRDELRRRDLAEADRLAAERKTAEPDPIAAYNLRFAKEGVELDLADSEMLDCHRQTAWRESGTLDWWVTRVPSNKGWPTGVTPEGFVRKAYGLNPEGTALLGQTAPAQESESAVTTFLDDSIAALVRQTTESN